MTMGNWVFWSIISWIGINLIWLGVFPNLPAWIGAIIATAIAVVILKFGPRPKDEGE